ncbi:MAG: cytochrome c3 family protein [Bryobacteraceae bacterium]
MRMRTGSVLVVLLTAGGAQASRDSCFDCHSIMEGTSVPFQSDVHYKNGVSCAACHGGDPNSDDQNIAMSAERGFKVRVTRDATSEYCARCHSDAALIHKYNPQQPVDQFALYGTGVHATRPVGSDSVAATCVDCHGVHNIRAVSDPQSAVSAGHLAATCGKCHQESAGMFGKSAHAAIFTTKEMPSCATCHASHATQRASTEMLAGGRAVCARCHEPDSKGGIAAASIERALERAMMASFSAPPAGTTAGTPPAAGSPGGRGMSEARAASNRRMKPARSAVHSLDAAAVKAAVAALSDQQ